MKDLSLYMLDIAQNSITAGSKKVCLTIDETPELLRLTVSDNGCGIPPELLAQVTDPFTTTRTTRKTGMGLPLLRMACEQTGGSLTVDSQVGQGTRVVATFQAGHVDCVPLGDIGATLSLLVQGAPELALFYTHTVPGGAFHVDTPEMRSILGQDIRLDHPDVVLWIRDYVREQESMMVRPERDLIHTEQGMNL